MCGISGIYKFNDDHVIKDDLVDMCSAIEHRGPDEAGLALLHGQKVGLSHVRLSIRDIKHGQQPMFNEDLSLAITYNGEIYDLERHRYELAKCGIEFRTHSDTEVVLKLYQYYGLDFVEHLNGEFACVIWDQNKKQLVAVRDRSGVKPLFFYHDQQEFVFSSEVKGLYALDRIERGLNPEFFYSTPFAFQVQGISPFKNIHSLKPGHRLVVNEQGIHESCYWAPNYDTDNRISFEEAKETLRHQFEQAVERRMVADVPVGTYLSGGIDSTLTCAMMSQHGPLKAFNLSYKDTIYDESNFARQIADFYGVELHTLSCTMDDLADNLEQSVYQSELLLANPGHVGKMLLSKFATEQGVKVCLTGEGADEYFAGYAFFKQEAIWRMLSDPNVEPEQLKTLNRQFEEMEVRSQEMNWTKSNSWRGDKHLFGYPSFRQTVVDQLSKVVGPNLFSEGFSESAAFDTPFDVLKHNYDYKKMADMHPLNASRQMSLSALSEYIIPVLGDRAEMANSLECRTPFLDNKMLEFATRLPPEYLLNIGELREKYIVHEAFKEILPPFMYSQHKHPFSADNWYAFATQSVKGGQLFDHYLSDESLKQSGVFNLTYLTTIKRLWRALPAHSPMLKKLQSTMGTVLCSQILAEKFIKRTTVKPDRIKVTDHTPLAVSQTIITGVKAA